MNNFNPKETLKELNKSYSSNEKGYYYLNDYAQTIKLLISTWQENEPELINGLYFIDLRLDDFINYDLPELYRVTSSNLKNKSTILREFTSKLMAIKNDFLIIYDNHLN